MFKERVVIPKKIRATLLYEAHNTKIGGYLLSVRKCIFIKEKIIILHSKSY